MKLTMFRTPKPRQYYHAPIYYNEQQEKIDKLVSNAEAAAGNTNEVYVPNMRGKFKSKQFKNVSDFGKVETRKSNIRLAIILILLMIIGYYFFLAGVEIFTKG